MNNEEIEEILDNLKDSVDNPTYEQRIYGSEDYEIVDNDYCLTPNKCKILLDYITDLQEENERKDRHINQLKEGIIVYAERNEKAIEYIKNHYLCYKDEREAYITCDRELLDILQGSNNE